LVNILVLQVLLPCCFLSPQIQSLYVSLMPWCLQDANLTFLDLGFWLYILVKHLQITSHINKEEAWWELIRRKSCMSRSFSKLTFLWNVCTLFMVRYTWLQMKKQILI
jgi:hypothetical protein